MTPSTPKLILLVLGAVGVGALAFPAEANRPPHPLIHVVHSGQKLATIAKRYGVSVDALCRANNRRPTDRLRIGERLTIPEGNDAPAAAARLSPGHAGGGNREPSTRRPLGRSQEHRVYPGQTLAKIAKRYRVSVESLCAHNDLACHGPLRPGTVLVIPDESGSASVGPGASRPDSHPARDRAAAIKPWVQYQTPPKKRGFVTLVGLRETWKGHVLDRWGHVSPRAREGISRVMGATGSRPRADPRLCELVVRVSDTFGGQPLRVVSGFRRESYAISSRHRRSQALDFSIPGVPNEVLRDFLLSIGTVGVGYYPHSSFVHLDVRGELVYWVDYSGPGEQPRYSIRRPHATEAEDAADDDSAAVDDANDASDNNASR